MTSAPEIGPKVPRLCFLSGRRAGGIEEVFEALCPPTQNILRNLCFASSICLSKEILYKTQKHASYHVLFPHNVIKSVLLSQFYVLSKYWHFDVLWISKL
ncbi:hypothetical protein GOODEAATRI_010420 [Goodea atripinnis]|uniref:Uncharacterized protein n=1 Tax=Goodea atripinnis TaxID=208336 RepID=A0ABV0NTJ3_9TELE